MTSSPHQPKRRSWWHCRIDTVLLPVLVAATVAVVIDWAEPDDPEPWLALGFLVALFGYLEVGVQRLAAAIRLMRHSD